MRGLRALRSGLWLFPSLDFWLVLRVLVEENILFLVCWQVFWINLYQCIVRHVYCLSFILASTSVWRFLGRLLAHRQMLCIISKKWVLALEVVLSLDSFNALTVGGPMCDQDFEFLQQPCLSRWSIHFSDDWLGWKYFFLVGPGLWTSQSTVCAKHSLCRANREKIFVNSFVHQVCEVQLNVP